MIKTRSPLIKSPGLFLAGSFQIPDSMSLDPSLLSALCQPHHRAHSAPRLRTWWPLCSASCPALACWNCFHEPHPNCLSRTSTFPIVTPVHLLQDSTAPKSSTSPSHTACTARSFFMYKLFPLKTTASVSANQIPHCLILPSTLSMFSAHSTHFLSQLLRLLANMG